MLCAIPMKVMSQAARAAQTMTAAMDHRKGSLPDGVTIALFTLTVSVYIKSAESLISFCGMSLRVAG
jgi:hypothetical protein